MTTWHEGKPAITDALSEFPSTLTQQATAFREGIGQHFFWTESSGLSAGVPRLSDTSPGPGSARVYFAPESALSASQDGKLLVTSDTSRLFAVGSAATGILGSHRAVFYDATQYVGSSSASFTPITNNTRVLVQSGKTTGLSSIATGAIAFPTAYTAPPSVIVSPIFADFNSAVRIAVTAIGASGFSFYPTNYAVAPVFGFYWRSEGTVTL